MKKRLILVGGGDFGREVFDWVSHAADAGFGQPFSGLLDDNRNVLERYAGKLPWLGEIDFLIPDANDQFIVAVANPETKRILVQKLKKAGAVFASFIHPSAVVAKSAVLGEGVVVCPQAVISSDVRVGNFVSVNVLSSVGHDVHIGDFSTLSAHVDITGHAHIGESVFFGSGARVLPKVKVGSYAKIGAGATIMRSVSEKAVMYTLPAKRL